ncbi:MAG: putative bifunctional diguanylate cyclase/phosphodiesterase [Acidimicrobiales bacterium]
MPGSAAKAQASRAGEATGQEAVTSEVRALGRALERHCEDVLAAMTGPGSRGSLPASLFDAKANPELLDVIHIATLSVARWLEHGEEAVEGDRQRIGSLGGQVADRRLSLSVLIKANLRWRDALISVMGREADRLGAGPAARSVAVAAAHANFDTAIVMMAKKMDSELESLRGRLSYLAMHDELTGLPNRSVFLEQLSKSLARAKRSRRPVSVVSIGLDHFKMVNDSLGHSAADEVLADMARRLRVELRPEDDLARLGGDQFVAACEDMGPAEAEGLAKRLAAAISEPLERKRGPVFITASIGSATAGTGPLSADEAVRRAESAMYAAKRAGGSQVRVVGTGPPAEPDSLSIVAGLHEALEQGQLRLFYQPLVDLGSGRARGFEALIRWQHPTRGLLAPVEFLGVAEESGLIVPIGTWVLGEACREAVRMADRREGPVEMSVNVSPRQLGEPGFVDLVTDTLSSSGLDPALLVLEVTEEVFLADPGAEQVLESLRAVGVGLALDDFGTGYSSMSYLRRFRFSTVKIDRCFVEDLEREGGSALLAGMARLAHDLGLSVVAEGIESKRQLSAVRELGCDVGQGYLLGRPAPVGP